MQKKCTKCHKSKDLTQFYKVKSTDGLRNDCKACVKRQKQLYYQNNKNSILRKMQNYYAKNKVAINDRHTAYYSKNKEQIFAQRQTRYQCDIEFKLAKNLRNRLNMAINKNYKSGSAVSDLGCSISEFKKYIESKFKPGMTWDNHGQWHIDHIRPLSSFDLTDPAQLKEACRYTNLQPLWAKDNIKKSNNYGT